MNKKGQDVLNVTEMVVVALCLFLSFWLITSSTQSLHVAAKEKVLDSRFEYQTIQIMRTLMQTTVKVEDKSMSYGELINKYYELENIKDSERTIQQTTLEMKYKQLIKDYANKYAYPHLKNIQRDYGLVLLLQYFSNDEVLEERNLFLLGDYSTTFGVKSSNLFTSRIFIPAYFEHSEQTLGSYHIEMVMGIKTVSVSTVSTLK